MKKFKNNFLFMILFLIVDIISIREFYDATTKEGAIFYGTASVLFMAGYLYYSYKWHSEDNDDDKPKGGDVLCL